MFSLFGKSVKSRKKRVLEQHLDVSSLVNSYLFVVYMSSFNTVFYCYVLKNGNDGPSIAWFWAASVSFLWP